MKLPVHIVTAVWGEEYSRLFLRVLAPSLMTPRNLPALLESMDAVWRIYTLEGERERFEGTPELAALRAVVPVAIIEVPLATPRAEHSENISAMVRLHRLSIEEAEKAGAALIFLSPDSVFADGSLATIADLARRGKRAVMIPGLRLVREDFLAEYEALRAGPGPHGLSPRALVALALRHLHPWTRALFWSGPELANTPGALLWRVGAEGVLGRFYHLHPVFVNPERRSASLVRSSVDDDFVALSCPDRSKIAVIRDSDWLAGFELSSRDDVEKWWRREPRSILRVAEWATTHADSRHRGYFRRPIVYHIGARSSVAWRRARAASSRVAFLVRVCRAANAPAMVGALSRLVARAKESLRPAVTRMVVAVKGIFGIERPLLAREAPPGP